MAPARIGSQSAQSPAPAPPPPQPSFRKIEGEDVNEPAGVNDLSSRSYGYNDFSFFSRPDHYIRYIEPIESELTNQVEYDMDEQDQEWLDLVNEERKKAQVGTVSPEIFEIMMDRLEKEWFELMKRVPKQDIGLPSEDSTCAICDDGEGENSNAIVFCDGCNLAVHQDCYGVPYIPEGQWLCRKCTVSPEVPVPCVFCPNEGGAFKQTTSGQWAHLLCAMFIPEVSVGNMLWMEPIDNVEKVPKSRWKLTCSLCKIKHGACIQCDKNTCFAAFHVTCARRAKLLMGMKGLAGDDASYKGYCEKHLPEDVKKARGEVVDVFEGPLTVNGRALNTSKSARAYSKKYNLGPPLVPQLIADNLDAYYKKHFRNKSQFIYLVCKYWSLKREARRGAPLLKRLHLEPWTASTVSKQQTDQEKALKLQYLIRLRKDLETVRMLAELVRKREQQKLNQAQLLDDIVSKILFPHEPALRHAFEQIKSQDKNELFHRPVTRVEAPDYFDIIKHPMSFMSIDGKLDKGEYLDVESFKSDINLVFKNAMLYNKRDTVFHKTAARLNASAAVILASLDSLAISHPEHTDRVDETLETAAVGNLEAEVENLGLLLSEESIKDDTDLLIGTEPVTSLFSIEHGRRKPPPPRLPTKQKKERPKRDYKLERERRKQARASLAAESALLLDASPGFRAPRATRSTRAALAALEAEVAAGSSHSPVSESIDNNAITNGPSSNPQDTRYPESQTPATELEIEAQKHVLSRKPRSWRREHLMLPGQGGPNMVESMDDQGSFKNFDRGWILPSGSRRHGRAVPETLPRDPPSPKKRNRPDRAKSRLSVMSTDPVDNLTLNLNSQARTIQNNSKPSMEYVTPMDVDQSAAEPSVKDQNFSSMPMEYFTPVRMTRSNGSTMASPSDSRTAPPEFAPSTHGVKRKRSTTQPSEPSEMEMRMKEEDTSQAVEGSQIRANKQSKKRGNSQQQIQAVPKVKAPGPPRGMIKLEEGKTVPGATLVWAKMESYPWWAAVVWEEDDKAVPMNVLRSKSFIPRTEPGPLTLVQFYDKARSWQWLELSNLRMLGEDKELDSNLLSGRAKYQVFRTPRLRQGCRGAYREAVAEMEGPEGETNEGTTNASMEPSASLEPKEYHPRSPPRAATPQMSMPQPPLPVMHTPPLSVASTKAIDIPMKNSGTKEELQVDPEVSGVEAPPGQYIPPMREIVRPASAMSSELSALGSEG